MTTTIEIPTAILKAALVCASTEKVRYYLNGVYVDPKGFLVSTDGHRLFCGKFDLTDVPAFDGWIIPSDAIKRALTGYRVETITIAPDRVGAILCAPVDGNFPDWRRVVPDELSGETAQFNPAYVADMGKIGVILRGKRKNSLDAHIHHNGEAPAAITFPEIDHAFAVLMPIRAHHSDNGSTAWSARRALVKH
jgi:DNA polymerase III subunit beta